MVRRILWGVVQAELQAWVAAGDVRRAASSLVVDYGSDVLATCLAMVRDRTAAEDLTQDIFSDAIRGLSSFRGEAAPRTWLLSIARNRCIDYLRARKRDAWGGTLDDDARDPDAHPDEAASSLAWLADRDEVSLALDALAEGDRALVVLRFKNGLDYDELATAFGLRSGTVRMRVSRALARMREVLDESSQSSFGAAPAPAPPRAAPAPPRAAPAPPRAAMPGGFGAMPGGAPRPSAPAAFAPPGAGAAAAVAPSWWQRLVGWARGPVAAAPAPVGDVGRVLAASQPSTPSEALLARLGGVIDKLTSPA